MKTQYFRIGKGKDQAPVFSGGEITSVPSESLADSSSPYLRNARLTSTSTKSRPGYKDLYIYPGTTPLGIGKLDNTLFFGTIFGLRKSTPLGSGGSPVLPSPSACSGTPSHTIGHDNMTQAGLDIFVTNSSYLPYAYNPSLDAVSTIIYPTAFPSMQPAFSVMFDGSLWAAGGNLETVMVKSVKNAPLDFDGIGSDNYSFPEKITGLAATYAALFIFTRNQIHVVTRGDIRTSGTNVFYDNRPISSNIGLQYFRTISKDENNLYFMSSNRKICKIVQGQTTNSYIVQDLSHRPNNGIEWLLSYETGYGMASDSPDAYSTYMQKEGLVAFHFCVWSGLKNNFAIIYDASYDKFLPDTGKMYHHGASLGGINYALDYDTTGSGQPYIVQEETGQTDAVGRYNRAIKFVRRSKAWTFGYPGAKKQFMEAYLSYFMSGNQTLICDFYLDGSLVATRTLAPLTATLPDTLPPQFQNAPGHIENIWQNTFGSNNLPWDSSPLAYSGINTDNYDNQFGRNYNFVFPSSQLNQRGYIMEVVWHADVSGGQIELKDFDIKWAVLSLQSSHY